MLTAGLCTKQYSDRLLERLLEVNDPERCKRRSERFDLRQFDGDLAKLTDEQLAQLEKSYAGPIAAAHLLRSAAQQGIEIDLAAPGYPQLSSGLSLGEEQQPRIEQSKAYPLADGDVAAPNTDWCD